MADKTVLRQADDLVRECAIPTRPAVLLDARRLLNGFAPDPGRIMAIILNDMALSSQVLQTANSALRGCKREVAGIEQAVALLGMERLRGIVQELFLSADLTSRDSASQAVRHQGVAVARLAAWLARELPAMVSTGRANPLPPVPPEMAYAAGLFHDCGQLALIRKHADYPPLLQGWRPTGAESLEEVEQRRFGVDHALLGSRMARARRLPSLLVRLIREHHDPVVFARPEAAGTGGEPRDARAYAALHAVLFLAQQIGGELSEAAWRQGREGLLAFFGLGSEALERLQRRGLEVINGRGGEG